MQMTMTPARSVLLSLALLLATGPAPAAAQQEESTVLYLVRHAETAPDGTSDPALSAAGQARAARLARMLSTAGLDAIHTTAYRRTRQTAGAVARATGLSPREYDPRDLAGLAGELIGEGGRHLVVGHSNTTPELVRVLGGDPGDAIPETEYGRVYVISVEGGVVHTARLGYPEGPARADATPAAPLGQPVRPAADSGDVASIDALIAALYASISGPAGQPRDWDRLRSLFLPTARMIPVQRAPDGRTRYSVLTVDEYIEGSGPRLTSAGFTEVEIGRRLDRFGDVAHVFSAYEGHIEGQAEPVARGINTIQLMHDGSRWWITSIAWSPESANLKVPAEYEDRTDG